MGKLESSFQKALKEELTVIFPGCEILKVDCLDKPGRPDLLILYKDRWASLEVKRSSTASHRPNQDYWVDEYNRMSYSAFIFPENKEVILDELRHHFKQAPRD
jgi:hypothetical protein